MKPLRIAKHNIWQPHEVVLTDVARTRTDVPWVSDKNTRACQSCGTLFSSVFLRRHHCRSCGQVICADCSRFPSTGLAHLDPVVGTTGSESISTGNKRICNECECELECISRGIDPQRVFDFVKWYLTSPESDALAQEAQRLEAVHSRLKRKLEAIVTSRSFVVERTRQAMVADPDADPQHSASTTIAATPATSDTGTASEPAPEGASNSRSTSADVATEQLTPEELQAESERINSLVSEISLQLTSVERRLTVVHLRRGVVLPVQMPASGMVSRQQQPFATNPASVSPSAQAVSRLSSNSISQESTTDSPPPLARLATESPITTSRHFTDSPQDTPGNSNSKPASTPSSSQDASGVDYLLRQVLDSACPTATQYSVDAIKAALERQLVLWARLAGHDVQESKMQQHGRASRPDAVVETPYDETFSTIMGIKTDTDLHRWFKNVPFAPGVRLLTMLPIDMPLDEADLIATNKLLSNEGMTVSHLPRSPFAQNETCLISLTGLLFPLDTTAPCIRAAIRSPIPGVTPSGEDWSFGPMHSAARETKIASSFAPHATGQPILIRGINFIKERLVKCFSLDQLLTPHGIYTKPVMLPPPLNPPTPASSQQPNSSPSPLRSPLQFLTSLFSNSPPTPVTRSPGSAAVSSSNSGPTTIFSQKAQLLDSAKSLISTPSQGLGNSGSMERLSTQFTLLSIGYYPSYIHQFYRAALATSGREAPQAVALGGLGTGIDLSTGQGGRAQRPSVALRPDKHRRLIGRINSTPVDVFRVRSFGRVSGFYVRPPATHGPEESSNNSNSNTALLERERRGSDTRPPIEDEEEIARKAGAVEEIMAIAMLPTVSGFGASLNSAPHQGAIGGQKKPPCLPPRPHSLVPDVLNLVTCPPVFASFFDAVCALEIPLPRSHHSADPRTPKPVLEYLRNLYSESYVTNPDSNTASTTLEHTQQDVPERTCQNPPSDHDAARIAASIHDTDSADPIGVDPDKLISDSSASATDNSVTLNADQLENNVSTSQPEAPYSPTSPSIRSLVLARVGSDTDHEPQVSARSVPYSAQSQFQASSATREATPHLFATLVKACCAKARKRCVDTLHALKHAHESVSAAVDPREPSSHIVSIMTRLWNVLGTTSMPSKQSDGVRAKPDDDTNADKNERPDTESKSENPIPELPRDPRWKLLGFQSDNPLTDLRAMGLFSIEALIYLGEMYPDVAKELVRLQSVREYPLAASTIGIVAYAVGLLALPPKSVHLSNGNDSEAISTQKLAQLLGFPISSTTSEAVLASQSPLHRLLCLPSRLTPSEQIFELITQLLCLVDMLFASIHAGYMQFPLVFAEVSERCAIALARHPPSFEAFLELLMATPFKDE